MFTFAPQREPDLPSATARNSTPPQEGLFKIKTQTQRAPVITVGNSTPYELRLVLEDSAGRYETEQIPSEGSTDVTLPQGDYEASIDAPEDEMVVQTNGNVDVKSFHHYEADFILVPASSSPSSFYIGD
jgi:hypothetical protein